MPAAGARHTPGAMPQILVIGPEADAIAERIDPAAVSAPLPAPGTAPLVAARHAGHTLDPAELADALRDAAVASVAAGLLDPLTPRYAVRDLARDLGAPVLLSLAPGPHRVSDARLALEAARGAGLRVIDVVLTGWPDPPDRAAQDERSLLAELADVPVVTFPGPEPWPVEEWLAAPAQPSAAGAARRAGRVVLEPYSEWSGGPVGDPRETPRPQIMATLLDIVEVEGPMITPRAFALYNRASGGRKLTTIARTPLASALHWLARERRVVLGDEEVARLPDAPTVSVRELGPRILEEVPLDEIAELMRRLGAVDPKRAVLDAYGLRRLTARADAYLERAAELAAASN